MYTLREETKTDFEGTLRRVARLGYQGVELAGYGADDAERSFAEVGAGTLELPAICDAAELGRAEWLIVEQDRTTGPAIESVARSIEALRAWGKV
jgi:sugar phosphate isomerase/epimerase